MWKGDKVRLGDAYTRAAENQEQEVEMATCCVKEATWAAVELRKS